jgi:hypothetical protein
MESNQEAIWGYLKSEAGIIGKIVNINNTNLSWLGTSRYLLPSNPVKPSGKYMFHLL